jgi:hypothetical protein
MFIFGEIPGTVLLIPWRIVSLSEVEMQAINDWSCGTIGGSNLQKLVRIRENFLLFPVFAGNLP